MFVNSNFTKMSQGQTESFTGSVEGLHQIHTNTKGPDNFLPRSTIGLPAQEVAEDTIYSITTGPVSPSVQETLINTIRQAQQRYEVNRIEQLMASTGLLRQQLADLLSITRQQLHKILSYRTDKVGDKVVRKVDYLRNFVAAIPEGDQGLLGLHLDGDPNYLVEMLKDEKITSFEAAKLFNEAINVDMLEFEPMDGIIGNSTILPKALPVRGE